MNGIKVAIDASRVRSGGGIAHLIGILQETQIEKYGIKEIHLWAYQTLLDKLPERHWLIKHNPIAVESNLIRQLIWQAFSLEKEIKAAGCSILFSADASTFCRFKPMVVLNQNMLPYEEGMIELFGLSRERLRQHFICEVQKRAFIAADGVIFLTQHAANSIQKYTGPIKNSTCIPHGVDEVFANTQPYRKWPNNQSVSIRCIYVSPIHEYKYQWVVVRAIKMLRDQGINIKITLIGGGSVRAKKILQNQIEVSDPRLEFVEVYEFLPHNEIPKLIAGSDIFVFASGCETFGISLLEAMSIGIPIASSNKSSLPETLRDGGLYFDPESDTSIANALKTLILDADLREKLAVKAKKYAEKYSWTNCSRDTWTYIVQIHKKYTEATIN